MLHPIHAPVASVRPFHVLVVFLIALVGSLPGLGCSKEAPGMRDDGASGAANPSSALFDSVEPTGVKILLVGIDGASYEVLFPLVRDGQLPHLRALLEEGSYGPLMSRRPMLSPAIWTTIVTGRPRSEHGIEDFKTDSGRLVTSNDRRSLALWNVTSPFGVTNGWAGFWATWPAEPLRGWMLSDRIARTRFAEWNDGAKRSKAAWPPDVVGSVARRLVDPMSLTPTDIQELVTLTAEESDEFRAFTKPQHGHGLSVLKFAFAAQRSYEEMAWQLLDRWEQPDLTGIFLVACDAISHTFWHYYRADEFDGVDRREAARLGDIVPAIYRHDDRVLGELLERVDENTVVIVVSDHGFEASGVLPRPVPAAEWAVAEEASREMGQVAVGQSGRHHPMGVFVASGGPIVPGARFEASILDVTPTILALLGLPVADDMPGRVLDEIVEPAFFEEHPIQRIPTYEGLVKRERVETEGSSLGEAALREQLESLGYLRSSEEGSAQGGGSDD